MPVNSQKLTGASWETGVVPWQDIVLKDISIPAGLHKISIVSEGNTPDKYNLDSITFGGANKSDLLAAIEGAPKVQGEYTDASWAALVSALNAATTVYENAQASQAAVENALAALNLAIAGLDYKVYPVVIEAGIGGEIVAGDSGNYKAGAEIEIEAKAAFGYSFANWTSANGAFADFESAATVFIAPSGGATVTASFSKNPITSLTINAQAATTVVRGGTYSFAVTVNPDALPDGIEWSVSNTGYVAVNKDGSISILSKTGTVVLFAKAPSGVMATIVLRIV